MKKLKLLVAAFAVIAFGSYAFSQGSGFWPNWPLVGSGSYCVTTVNGTCTATVPAGPSVVSGNETIPANYGAQSNSTTPNNILIGLASLNALPVLVVAVTLPPSGISATNISGGVLYTSATTITSANITLPAGPIDGQQYRVSANRTITTLTVAAGGTASIGGNTNPTVLTASTTAPQGYTFRYNAADTSWYRMQ